MKVILSKNGNVVWEYIQLAWFTEAIIIYLWFLGILS